MATDSLSDIEFDLDNDSNNDDQYYEPLKYQINYTDLNQISYKKSDLTYALDPAPNKILVLNSIANFDLFTDKYAYIRKPLSTCSNPNSVLGINWIKVKKDYKGLKIEMPCYDRFFMAKYRSNKYISWRDAEFYCDRYFL
jgi:hypothetical protein